MADFVYLLETRLSPDQQRAVTLVTDVARSHQMNVYLTGGAVRDILSGFIIRDLDFSVQGNAIKLQKDFEKAGAVIEATEDTSRTIMLLLPGNVRAEVTSTRSEKYDKPGKPPETTPGTIYDDMRRRDFTINAMALSLNPGSRGLLSDPFNGMADIEGKVLRILNNYAFYEEPSRLIRATRLCTRFHWALEERTQARYDAAKENNYIENVSDRLLGHELEQIAHEDNPVEVLKALEKEGWLKILNPHFAVAKVDTAGLTQLFKVKQQVQEVGLNPEVSPLVMHFLTRKFGDKEVAAIQKQIPNKGFIGRWRNLEDDTKEFVKQLNAKDLTLPSKTWKFLTQSRPETVLYAAITSRPSGVEQKLKNFLTKWPSVKQKLPFPEMPEMRITADLPDYKKILEEAFFLLLDGKLRNHTEIVKFLTPYKPPEPPPPPQPVRRGRGAKKDVKGVVVVGDAAGPKKRGRKPKVQPQPGVVPAPPAPQEAPASAAVTAEPKAAKAGKPAKETKPQETAKAPAAAPAKKTVAPEKPEKPEKKAAVAKPAAKKPEGKPEKAKPAKDKEKGKEKEKKKAAPAPAKKAKKK
ncbi:MAG TPA: CCA tRNA nucleotidyltransferase [Candidatus Angelobacter sp.]|nr:CCA tRNA nucleotidyltransferase [Candidatus Angelobacter sp.]